MRRRTSGGLAALPYEPSYDGLRGVGVVAVVVGHLGRADGAVYALDLFFVLSGFLITGLMLRAVARFGSFQIVRFWGRRFRRLFPAMLLTIVFAMLYALLAADRGELHRIRGDGISALFYVNNWYAIANDNSYADIFRLPSPLQHLWTLSIEEQFYLVWPLLFGGVVWLLRNRTYRERALGVLATATVVSVFGLTRLIQLSRDVTDQSRLYYGTDTRSFALAAGSAVAALVVVVPRPKSSKVVWFLDKIGVFIIAGLITYWLTARINPAHVPIHMFVMSDLLVLLGVWVLGDDRAIWMRKALSPAPLVMLGVISYGVYLYHWPLVVWLTPERLGLDGWSRTGVVLVLSIVLAAISFVAFEQPIMKGALPKWQGVVAIPVSILLVGGLVLYSTKDATSLADEVAGLGSKQADGLQIVDNTPHPAPPNRPHILIAGDSQAGTLGMGFLRLQSSEKISAMNRGTVGCGITLDDGAARFNGFYEVADHPRCHEWPERWKEYVHEYRPNVAMLVVGNPGAGERKIDGQWYGSCSPEGRADVRSAAIEAIEILGAEKADVYVATALYLDTSGTYIGSKLTGYSATDTDCVNEEYKAAVAAVPGTRLIDLNAELCHPDGTCDATFRGARLRKDGVHIENDGAVEVARWILDQLAPPPGLL